MLWLSKNLTGIDIGSYSVKLVAFGGRPGAYSLKAAACFKLPSERGQAKPVEPGFLSEMIRSQRAAGRRVAALFTGHSLIFKHLHLPEMPEKDLKEAVKWEVRKELSIAPDDLVSDYVLAGRGKDKTLSIIAFAAMKNEIESEMRLFKEAGVDLRALDAAPTALLSAFDLNNEWEPGVNYGMLDVGETKSTFAILKDKTLSFVREISVGGGDITRSLAQALNIDHTEAEYMKVSSGLTGDKAALKAMTAPLERLSTELHRSIDYYQAQFREGGVSKLFLSGGTARLIGIDGLITTLTGIQSYPDDPLRKIKIPKGIDRQALGAIAPCLSIAAGLAAKGPR
ncbi:MAG: type IV pilus assembly protein PilM [Deltaproteobacteria bacterium]|nr:type IV pilus assembly protein PilM [Deltaproteobacteria bacterium]